MTKSQRFREYRDIILSGLIVIVLIATIIALPSLAFMWLCNWVFGPLLGIQKMGFFRSVLVLTSISALSLLITRAIYQNRRSD